MHAARAAFGVLALAAAFGLGRQSVRGAGAGDPAAGDVASLRRALEDEDALARTRRMSAFLEHLSPENLPAAQAALLERQAGTSREEVRLFLLAWARFDAPGAFAWAQAQPEPWRRTWTEEAISAWSLAETERGGPEAVMRWADAIPDDAPNGLKRAAFASAAARVASADPARAAAWYEAHRGDPYSAGALEAIARSWVTGRDPPALFAWLEALGDLGDRGAERRRAAAHGFRLWLRGDPQAASAWLRSEPPRAALDPAVAAFARAIAATDPTDAFEWAERIENEPLRRRTRISAARTWLRHDPAAGRAWIESNDPEGELPRDAD